MRFIEVFPIVGRIGVIEELFAPRTTHPAGDEAATGNQIDFGQFFGHA
jgi:hypothetical protein